MRLPGSDDQPAPEPTRTLREVIATNPEARERVGRAYAELLAAVLVAVAGFSLLLLWHLARRGRRIRERLGPPRPTRWPDGGEAIETDAESDHSDRPEDRT